MADWRRGAILLVLLLCLLLLWGRLLVPGGDTIHIHRYSKVRGQGSAYRNTKLLMGGEMEDYL